MATDEEILKVLSPLTSSLPPAKTRVYERSMGLLLASCLLLAIFALYKGWDWSVPLEAVNEELAAIQDIANGVEMLFFNSDMTEPSRVAVIAEPPLTARAPLPLLNVIPPPDDVDFPGGVGDVAFRPGGVTLAVGEDRGYVRLYDPTSGTQLQKFSERERDYFQIAFSSDGTLLAGASRGGVYCWRTEDGELVFSATGITYMKQGKRYISSINVEHEIGFSHDGQFMAVCGSNQIVILNTRDGSTRQIVDPDANSRFPNEYHRFRCLCFVRGTNEFYAGTWHSTDSIFSVYGWSPEMARMQTCVTARTPASILESSHDGSMIAMQTEDGEIRVLGTIPAGPLNTGPNAFLKVPLGQADSMAFSSDGRFLFAGGSGNKIRCWTLGSDEPPMTFTCEGIPLRIGEEVAGPSVLRIATNDDGSLLACGCSDLQLRIFDLGSLDSLRNPKTAP